MSYLRQFVSAVALVAISGCGGGSGGTASGSGGATPMVATTTSGTIAGFGSIVINGTHYDTSGASFTVDDAPGTQSDLNAGEVVTISGASDSQNGHVAHAVTYDSSLVGPVSAINSSGNSFTALGQTVLVGVTTIYQGAANFAALAVGNNVAVSGERDASGNINATYVRLLATAPSAVRLSGVIAGLNASAATFSIGAETIGYGGATITPPGATLANALPVNVTGTLDTTGTTIAATKVRVHRALEGAGPGDHGEVEGIITQSAQGNSFVVGTQVVDFDATTVFKGGSAADLVTGNRIEAHGTLNADGSLQAGEIDIEAAQSSGSSYGILAGALSSAPDTTSTPNTISLLGVTVTVTSSTILSDNENHDQMFKLSDLNAGDRVVVALQLTPGSTAGAAPALTALKIERPGPGVTVDGASGAFSNVNPAALTLTVETINVAGQQSCAAPGASSSSSSSSSGGSSGSGSSSSGGSGSSSGGTGASNCTAYFIHEQPSTSSAFFQALGSSGASGAVVMALGAYSSNVLTAQKLDLRTDNESGD